MDFGGEEKDPSTARDANDGSTQRESQYLASAGVGVRVKAYKKKPTSPDEVEPAPVQKPAVKAGSSKRGRKSLKQATAEADLIEIPADEILFGKQYYTMGEVSEMFKVNQSLLRYWETEFDILQPRKNKKGDRYFRPVDIKNLHLIYHLLRQRKYTIEGAKDFLRNNKKANERFEVIERLQQIRNFLLEWKAQL
jgi:DNA-binding transcriptional MerR regulator